MEEQNELNIGIGEKDRVIISLQPAKVKIVHAYVEDTKKAKKVVFEVKHPEKDENIRISSASHIVDRNLKIAGTWLNLDEDNNLQKGSALVSFLNIIGANNIKEAIGKEADTELDGKYLCFKAY